jgi:hypothetical protein
MKTKTLKCIIISLSFILYPLSLSSQPQGLSYQAVVRNASGTVLSGQAVSFRFSILNNGGTSVYTETQSATTNTQGIVSLVIGSGTVATGNFTNIDWGTGGYSLKVEMDPSGGMSYSLTETKLLQSVPYALYGKDEDADATNELQTLSISGNEISISEGNTITLPTGTMDLDADPTNELQTLSITGTDLSISGGNSVPLPAGSFLWQTDETNIYRLTGKVGIGTSSPARLLDVVTNNSSTEDMMIHIGEHPNEGGYLGSYVPSDLLMSGGADYISGTGWTARDPNTSSIRLMNGGIYFGTNSGLTVGNPFTPTLRMLITSSGNMGIGTNTPTNRLQIGDNSTNGAPVPNPNALSLGNDYGSNTIGTNFKLKLYDPPLLSNTFGFGISVNLLEIIAGNGGSIGFFTNGANERMRITADGKIGIGTTIPAAKLHLLAPNGELSGLYVTGNDQGSSMIFVGQSSMYGGGLDYDGQGMPDIVGGFDRITYFRRDNGVDNEVFSYGFWGNTVDFKGAINVQDQVNIGPSSAMSDEIPLFEIKNNHGIPVFQVFNNGVRVIVQDETGKGSKSGFAVGGYNPAKTGYVHDLMRVTPDSIRFYIADPDSKGSKGGFAVGGYNPVKQANQEFMYLTPKASNAGQYNTCLGFETGQNTAAGGDFNTFLGHQAGKNNTTGWSNVFIGTIAGFHNTIGTNNICIGNGAGSVLNSGSANIIIGNSAGANTNGGYNIMLGYWAGSNNKGGSSNVFIGTAAGYNYKGSNKLIIDHSGSNPIIWGDFINRRLVINGDSSRNINNRTFFVYGSAGGTTGWYNDSDKEQKKEITSISNPLMKIMNLRGVNFYWKEPVEGEEGLQMGFIGQEAAEVIPEVVNVVNNHYTMQYAPITALLVEALKEQQKLIEDQKSRIEKLEAQNQRMAELETMVKQLQVAVGLKEE